MKDLTKANELIKKIAEKNSHITPITPTDFDLFQEFFEKERHTYGNSWTYITQGMYGIGPHNLGYKYYDGENISTLCIYPKADNPNIYACYWVRPMGPKILKIISTFSKQLLKENNMPTYVKKIFEDQFEFLVKQGFKNTSYLPWHPLSPSEDDTYPEQIINIEETLQLAENAKKNTRLHRTYKYYKFFKSEDILRFFPIYEKQIVAKKVLLHFFDNIHLVKKHNFSNPEDYFNIIEQPINNNKKLDYLIYQHEDAVGFCFVGKQTNNYASLYATITLRDLSNHIADYLIFKLLYDLKEQGIMYLNLGGSEDETLYLFKKKFRPKIEQQMYWATFT